MTTQTPASGTARPTVTCCGPSTSPSGSARSTALTDVNLRLAQGEVLGLIGDNGAGKSTLLKILCGFQPPDSGRILLTVRKSRSSPSITPGRSASTPSTRTWR